MRRRQDLGSVLTGIFHNLFSIFILAHTLAASAAKFWKRVISNASEEHFRGFWAIFLVAQLSPKRRIFVHKNSLWHLLLVNGVVTASSHALWRVLSNIVIWLRSHFWVDTPQINTLEGDSVLSKLVVCSPPSRSRRPRLGLCQRKRFRHCWRRPQGHYFLITKTSNKRLCTRSVGGIWCVEDVGDHHGQETGLESGFDYSSKKWTFGSGPLLCQRFWGRREETVCERKRIEISLVFNYVTCVDVRCF